jgi:hypothetical protein
LHKHRKSPHSGFTTVCNKTIKISIVIVIGYTSLHR